MKGAIYSVGGSPEPILKSLRQYTPEVVLFVVSEKSGEQVKPQIVDLLGWVPQWQKLVLKSEDSLEEIYSQVKREIPVWLERYGLQTNQVYFDYTGGTKSMSAGLVLAAVEVFPGHNYVSGVRNLDGLGTVMDGTERMLVGDNPWHLAATRERIQATQLYALGQVEAAAELLRDGASRAVVGKGSLELMASFCDVLASLQLFQFEKAAPCYFKIADQLGAHFDALGDEQAKWFPKFRGYLKQLVAEAKDNFEGPRRNILGELLLNARRCAKAGRFDDGVARLYRAVEMHGQNALAEIIPGAQSGRLVEGKVKLEDMDRVKQAFPSWKVCLDSQGKKKMELSLAKLYECASAIGGAEYLHMYKSYNSISNHLQSRNLSILAHGLIPLTKSKYEELAQVMDSELKIQPATEMNWPVLKFGS